MGEEKTEGIHIGGGNYENDYAPTSPALAASAELTDS